MAQEVQLGDTDLDTQWFIITDHPHNLELALKSPGFLQSVKQLLSLPVEEIHATRTHLWCHIKEEDLDKKDPWFDTHITLLRTISESLKATAAQTVQRRHIRKMNQALSAMTLHMGLVINTFWWGAYLPVDDTLFRTFNLQQLLIIAIPCALEAVFLWYRMLVALFRKTSWMPLILGDFFLCGALGIVFSVPLLIQQLNLFLPQPEPTFYRAQVLQRGCQIICSSNGRHRTIQRHSLSPAQCRPQERDNVITTLRQKNPLCNTNADFRFHLVTTPIPAGFTPSQNHALELTRPSLYDALPPGSFVDIPHSKGALGIEWMNTQAPRPATY